MIIRGLFLLVLFALYGTGYGDTSSSNSLFAKPDGSFKSSDIKLTVKVMESQVDEAPNGTIVYPVEYTIINLTTNNISITSAIPDHELMVFLMHKDGIKELIYPLNVAGSARLHIIPIIKPKGTFKTTKYIPASIFDRKDGSITMSVVVGELAKGIIRSIYTAPLPPIDPSK